jgi:dihydrofolate reductase
VQLILNNGTEYFKTIIMRKLMMKMSITVDGFVGGPNGENDWVFRSSDETSRAWSVGQSWEAGLIIMGRKSFENMAPYWPTATGPFAAPMNGIPKALFTKKGFKGVDPVQTTTAEQSRATASWAEARIFDGDLSEGIKKLKSEPGKPILAIGGAGFMRSLIATGLIDEYYLNTHPVVLGAGLTIFNEVAQPLDLKLVDVKSFPGGIITRKYSI